MAECEQCHRLYRQRRDRQRFCTPKCRDKFHAQAHRARPATRRRGDGGSREGVPLVPRSLLFRRDAKDEPMDRFIARENIKHFRDRLCSEVNQDVRARLRELLVAEEDKLAANLELLANIDEHISDGNRRIDRQLALVNAMERDGHNSLAHAKVLLACLTESQLLHQEYRRLVQIRIDQSKL